MQSVESFYTESLDGERSYREWERESLLERVYRERESEGLREESLYKESITKRA